MTNENAKPGGEETEQGVCPDGQVPAPKESRLAVVLRVGGVVILVGSLVWVNHWMMYMDRMEPDELWDKAMGVATSFIVGVGFCAASAISECKSKWSLSLTVIAIGLVLLFFAGYSYLVGWGW